MGVVEWLIELGGVASRRTLVRLTSRAELERAVRAGDVVRCRRGHYGLRELDLATQLAVAAGGVLSHTSAAIHHGWAVKTVPDRPHVTVPRGRHVAAQLLPLIHLHRADLAPGDVDGIVTSRDVTLAACIRSLPFNEGLAVADSALRAGFGPSALAQIADRAAGPGAPTMRRVATHASPLPANPFESVLRAIALDVHGLCVLPQVELPGIGRPDLVDAHLWMVLEADSFEWHGGRADLARDARRYNAMVINGWMVLRFVWQDVMRDPDEVLRVLVEATAYAQLLTKVPRKRSRTA